MPDTDGHGPKKGTILYARVSTEDQARTGYSLAQQLEALKDYARREGYEVTDEVTDPGESGTSLVRPGMDKVRDLVEAGGVDVVLAQDADRITREPGHRAYLDEEFEKYGTVLRALDDWGDDSHEGQLLKYVKGWSAKGERLKTAERTRRGKRRKAREGKIVAPRKVTYGFKLNATRDGYEVDENEMPIVRRVFRMVAEGAGLHTVKRVLEDEHIPTPSGGVQWSRSTLRDMVRRDAYFPYAFAEIAALVLPDVAAKLDPDKRYGIWWSTRHDVKVVERVRTAEGKYTDRRTHGVKPREEWIAVPIPNAGIPQEVVERARRNIEHNFRPASKGRRGWELTGGLLYCGECGRKMVGHSVAPSGRKPYHYYVCPRKVEESWQICQNKAHSAEALEERVRDAVMRLLTDVERTERLIEQRIEREREAMRDPDREALWWAKRLEEIDAERKQSQKMAARGLMDLDVLDDLLDELEEERRTAQKELEAARGLKGRIEELENDRGIMLALYAGYASVDLTAFPSEERRRIYATLGLKIRAYKDKRTEIIISDPTADYFPPEEDEPRQLVERIIYSTERIKEREEQQARLAKKLNEGVMSCGELN